MTTNQSQSEILIASITAALDEANKTERDVEGVATFLAKHLVGREGWILLSRVPGDLTEVGAGTLTPAQEAALMGFVRDLQQTAISRATVKDGHKVLRAYKPNDFVEVLHHDGEWTRGYVSSLDSTSNYIHVETEKGPVTVATTRRIRPQAVTK
jgi:hypothetical protein